MRITRIREIAVPLEGGISNALVNFSSHTVSLVAVSTDAVRDGKPVAGLAFNSIGRYAQSGILRDRVIPRLLAADPDTLLEPGGRHFDPRRVLRAAMQNEKPGGHGDRAGAIGALELAFWDLNAKLNDEPAHAYIARYFGTPPRPSGVPVYAAGGYYYPGADETRIRDEFSAYKDQGFNAFKMKIGGATLAADMKRIEAVLSVAGDGARLAVDANGRFDFDTALAYARAIEPYGLRWYEEIGDPLDFDLNRRIAEVYPGAIATGENLFSTADVHNLLRYGGMRPSLDIFQMDAGLSYGLTEYARMIGKLEHYGYDRRAAHPHGGHLINLHIAAGLGLGGCEAYPGVFQPFGGYPGACVVDNGVVTPSDAPGFGLEQKHELSAAIGRLLA